VAPHPHREETRTGRLVKHYDQGLPLAEILRLRPQQRGPLQRFAAPEAATRPGMEEPRGTGSGIQGS